nr:Thymidylate kinase [uncultured bacterium]
MALLKRKPKKVKPQPGKLIVIDGLDGTGKTTQFNLLVETLKLAGYKVQTADFPRYGEKSASLVEQYLNGSYGDINAHAASIFYAIDRFDASFHIRQWLDEGYIVVSNRYVTANAGHQGSKIKDRVDRLKYFKWLNDLEHNIFNIPKPDLNIILHVPAAMARKLGDKKKADRRVYANGKKRDILEADLKHLKNAEQNFIEISKLFPNTKMVECVVKGKLLPPKQVHNKVWELVRRIALRNLDPQ